MCFHWFHNYERCEICSEWEGGIWSILNHSDTKKENEEKAEILQDFLQEWRSVEQLEVGKIILVSHSSSCNLHPQLSLLNLHYFLSVKSHMTMLENNDPNIFLWCWRPLPLQILTKSLTKCPWPPLKYIENLGVVHEVMEAKQKLFILSFVIYVLNKLIYMEKLL